MTFGATTWRILVIGIVIAAAVPAHAITPADKCVSQKMKTAGTYLQCRMKAEAKGVLKGLPADFDACDAKLTTKWSSIESHAAGACPTNGDVDGIQGLAAGDTGLLAGTVAAAARFQSDGYTTTDIVTGLTWENKSRGDSSANDIDTSYTPATAVSVHLAALNGASFGGYTDWRLPTVTELMSLINFGSGGPVLGYPAFDVSCAGNCALPTCSCAFTHFAVDSLMSSAADPDNPSRAIVITPADWPILVDSASSAQVMAVRGTQRNAY